MSTARLTVCAWGVLQQTRDDHGLKGFIKHRCERQLENIRNRSCTKDSILFLVQDPHCQMATPPGCLFDDICRSMVWMWFLPLHHLEPQTTIYEWMFGETTIFYIKIWNHPIETTIYKWLFGVPGRWSNAIIRFPPSSGWALAIGKATSKAELRSTCLGWTLPVPWWPRASTSGCVCQLPSLKLTIFALKKLPKPNRKVFFQPSFFRGELLNFQGVHFDFVGLG